MTLKISDNKNLSNSSMIPHTVYLKVRPDLKRSLVSKNPALIRYLNLLNGSCSIGFPSQKELQTVNLHLKFSLKFNTGLGSQSLYSYVKTKTDNVVEPNHSVNSDLSFINSGQPDFDSEESGLIFLNNCNTQIFNNSKIKLELKEINHKMISVFFLLFISVFSLGIVLFHIDFKLIAQAAQASGDSHLNYMLAVSCITPFLIYFTTSSRFKKEYPFLFQFDHKKFLSIKRRAAFIIVISEIFLSVVLVLLYLTFS